MTCGIEHEQKAHLLAGMMVVFGTVLPFLASFSLFSGLLEVDACEPLGGESRLMWSAHGLCWNLGFADENVGAMALAVAGAFGARGCSAK